MSYRRWAIAPFNLLEGAISRWLTGTRLPAHDHGGSCGIVFLFWGELHEKTFHEEGGRLIPGKEEIRRAPSISFLSKQDIHEVTASRSSMACHLYFPKPDSCRMFEFEGGRK